MSIAAQPLTTENPALSPWWLRTVLIVMVLGFAGLIAITSLAYRNAPPIPTQVLDAQVAVELKTNHYDAASTTLHLTLSETTAYHKQIVYWTDYFLNPERNGGLQRGLISDPTELQQFINL